MGRLGEKAEWEGWVQRMGGKEDKRPPYECLHDIDIDRLCNQV